MITRDEAGGLTGTDVYDEAGEHVGSVSQIYVDPHGGEPRWVTVRTGSFGFQESFVPLRDARLADGRLIVAVPGERIRQAPLLEAGAPLEQDHVDRLNAHYGLRGGTSTTDRTGVADRAGAAGQTGAAGRAGFAGHSGATDDAHIPRHRAADEDSSGDDAMTRSEERLVAHTEQEPVEKVRLRKYLVTEERQITVPVTREEVRLERVPADAPDADDDDITPTDVILHAQQPVVTTETVPVERVRLGKETVTEDETITRPVRKERIEYDGPEPR